MDVAYVCRAGENEELRYSLRSLVNLPHDNVSVYGGAPPWYTGRHVDVEQRGGKLANAYRALREATHDDALSDPFLLMNDDFFAVRKTKVPYLHRGDLAEVLAWYREQCPSSYYTRGMAKTAALLARLGVKEPISYELHVPIVVHKRAMRDALEHCAHDPSLHIRSVYGNLSRLEGKKVDDVKVYSRDDVLPRGPWLSTEDATFDYISVILRWLFPDRSEWEAAPSHKPDYGRITTDMGQTHKLGVDVVFEGVTYPRGTRIDHTTAVLMSRAGAIRAHIR